MSDEWTAHCPECDTSTTRDDVDDAVGVVENHNESRHDGVQVAKLNGIRIPQFSEEEKEKIRGAVQVLSEEDGGEA